MPKKTNEKVSCSNCHQPFHGLTSCDEAASPRIKALLAEADALQEKLQRVEQELYSLDYTNYYYTTNPVASDEKQMTLDEGFAK